MVTIDQVRDAMHSVPFVPFTVRMVDAIGSKQRFWQYLIITIGLICVARLIDTIGSRPDRS
jgi:hypothetical protein